MATLKRTDSMVEWVLRKLALAGAERLPDREMVLDAVNNACGDVAARALNLFASKQIYLAADVAQYVLSSQRVIRIAGVRRPESWANDLTVVGNADRWAEIINNKDFSTGTNPRYIRSVYNRIELYPAPITSGESLTVDAYFSPLALDFGKDPETDEEWDSVIRAFALAEFAPDFSEKAERDLAEMIARKSGGPLGVQTVNHWSNHLGF